MDASSTHYAPPSCVALYLQIQTLLIRGLKLRQIKMSIAGAAYVRPCVVAMPPTRFKGHQRSPKNAYVPRRARAVQRTQATVAPVKQSPFASVQNEAQLFAVLKAGSSSGQVRTGQQPAPAHASSYRCLPRLRHFLALATRSRSHPA